ncbi:UPF0147 family protein [Candidatus Woesearchaeota archaeon]|nr:UPF0147 family protein [Candidatus Woesearchaeota archaeon]
MEAEEAKGVVEALNELIEDAAVPKNVKITLQAIMDSLKSTNGPKDDNSMAVSKALNELDEIASDTNLQSYTRTQIWNVISVLEKFQ